MGEERMEVPTFKSTGSEKSIADRRRANREKKNALIQDVDKLNRKLRHEENIHRALERAFTRPLGSLPRLLPYLPPYTLEILAEVAVLEEEIARLEEKVINFRQGLCREAVYVSLKRNGKVTSETGQESPLHVRKAKVEQSRLMSPIEFCSQPGFPRSTPIQKAATSDYRIVNRKRVVAWNHSSKNLKSSTPGKRTIVIKSESAECSCDRLGEPSIARHNSVEATAYDGDAGSDSMPNKLSEEIVRCLSVIFQRASTSKRKIGELDLLDPYELYPDSGKSDIGPYKHLFAIESCSVDFSRMMNSLFLLQRLKFLLWKLATVKLEGLTHQQKLAFWINIYNSCMMNAILEHGMPENPERVIALIQKAKIDVGGQPMHAITIEHFVLRLPYHLKFTCPKAAKNDVLKGWNMYGLECSEPLVTFALSCGSWSSPAVRVYTASRVEDELNSAKRDFLQAAVGISQTNQIMIPELLDWYLLDFAKDMESLLDWVSLQLTDGLCTEAHKCLEMKGLGEPLTRLVQVVPHNFIFRLLLQQ